MNECQDCIQTLKGHHLLTNIQNDSTKTGLHTKYLFTAVLWLEIIRLLALRSDCRQK